MNLSMCVYRTGDKQRWSSIISYGGCLRSVVYIYIVYDGLGVAKGAYLSYTSWKMSKGEKEKEKESLWQLEMYSSSLDSLKALHT